MMADTRNNQAATRPHARAATRRPASGTAAGQAGDARTARTSASAGARNGGRTRVRTRQTNFMKYANDNRFVRAVYDFTTGPHRIVFYLLVAFALLAYAYGPARDLYVSYRTGDILAKQEAIQQKYKDGLETEVKSYLSEEGIEAAARKQGMVMPGERTITVTGDGSSDGSGSSSSSSDAGKSSSSDSSSPSTASEVEAAEKQVYEDSPWYLKMLDKIFLFSGVEGQAVVSGGDANSSSTDSASN